ncbi:class I SAM-dependent methyltransferase [Leptospira biflexa]|uniref:class I SAM-dependent methyltransferase n=1 Tax=Leptospira biflexa TaxID=172 RepID=UPI0010845534|nr:class I SAM-dependent methyltransferase [Leptospira biflexa]TGM34003.1 class I SAM-dependent methyltransferase [Leptospira biflexa]TGM39504.1 class I SAM-dependent methyltransferase [Leptospira biflexa]TGM41767.1 class I SAM-dependent methyltransferase [Leptospira biflexa]TGM51921.1 class I SAM-dependent methyltransferase [Leptospira biflexa]
MCSQKIQTLSLVNAYFFQFLQSYMHFKYRKIKNEIFGDLPKFIVELGPGVGSNLRYYKPYTTLLAIEPNQGMHRLLRKNSMRYKINLEILNLYADQLPFSDSSINTIVCSLVLCTVDNPVHVLNEVMRVLKPGGQFIFLEHVEAKKGSILERIQKIIHKPWFWFFEGCNLNRNTFQSIHSAGFSKVKMEKLSLNTIFFPIRPHIYGIAVK